MRTRIPDLVDKLLRSGGTIFPAFRASGRSRWHRSIAVSGLLGIARSPVGRTPKPKPRAPTGRKPAQNLDACCGLEAEIEDLRQRVAQLERQYVSSLPGGDETDDSGQDLETAGNIVCMPGVRLADVLPQNGGAA
jgi:hypothetical protein